MKLEVIAKSLDDIILINQSKADRVEYCRDLEVGGLTPSHADIKAVTALAKVPVNVMVRPHDQGYVYTEEEFQQILNDIDFIANETKAAGIVLGFLTPDGEVDFNRLQQAVTHAKDKTVTFHRAFQEVKNQLEALPKMEALGIHCILTSGRENINESLSFLKTLTDSTKINILGGGGVNFANIGQVKGVVDEIHVGTAIREANNWEAPISITKINELKACLEN
ncbi:copper homeostasis protein CutC [Entomoplasma freundtii]|uniref:Copper homeostasis protein cutC homolog n=1 Tax=Entomoplasma freundtii TaxID=74700 RepID=A0A2K8NQX2_9MOLU|nr:copper homeostasis protein CutC [Entomoplasma freundtii]ATZ16240.1 copper homeostasis protein [Entomoplasma freundtii]TDY56859.1 copper homeostasis protein CutC [Entomoplasma freundtii]